MCAKEELRKQKVLHVYKLSPSQSQVALFSIWQNFLYERHKINVSFLNGFSGVCFAEGRYMRTITTTWACIYLM